MYPEAPGRRCTCGWAKGPHATLCGLYVDEDADPFAKKTPDAVEELERDLHASMLASCPGYLLLGYVCFDLRDLLALSSELSVTSS